LRDLLHKDAFRFDVTPDLWQALYEIREDEKESSIISVTEDGKLCGYVIYFIYARGEFKHLSVLDVCADGEKTLAELVYRLKENAQKEDADLIYVRKAPEQNDVVFDQEGFLSFNESLIMVTLLNPHELLHAISQEIPDGKNLKLILKGFDPITVKIGKTGMKITQNDKTDVTLQTDAPTFLKLYFCRTSFLREWLKGRVKIDRISKLLIAAQFFKVIKQEKWHIPFGDWV
jgi:hypothetical protein